ncbi:MAG: outer membrane protein assembly factor BamE [Pseudomonadota bacterium]|nr:outer membrane protein assembly factor BamE [Pseudomonadota bacterium]
MTVIATRLFGAAAALTLVLAGGCTPLQQHQGYVIDADLVNSVQTGVDNRQSVLTTLGKPTFASEFNRGDWYYVSRDTRNFLYNNPKPIHQDTIRIVFNQAGTVSAVYKSGIEQIAKIKPYSKTTPTLGRSRGFFDDLFGNIGTVGAGGVGGGEQGGGRDTP